MSLHPGGPQSGDLRVLGDEFALFDQLPLLGWVANADGRATHFNRAWCSYTGKRADQMVGGAWQSVHDDAALPEVLEHWRRSVESGEPSDMCVLLKGRDGTFRWFMWHVVAFRDDNGRVARWIGTYTDVDTLKRAETSLANAVKKREDLLAIVSHDLRNPLSTVLMAAKQIELFAEDPKATARNKKAAQSVVRAVNQMTRLVGDLLDLARLAAEQPLRMEVGSVDVVELAAHAAEASAPIIRARKLHLEIHLPDEHHRALCDGDRLLQVLDNLLGNAIKFTREGGVIGLTLRREGDEIVFSVSDTGTGIRPDELPLIFEPYWQANETHRRGAGLGLSIVKAIVETQGGRVWVDTELGRGTTLHFTLPAMDATPVAKEET